VCVVDGSKSRPDREARRQSLLTPLEYASVLPDLKVRRLLRHTRSPTVYAFDWSACVVSAGGASGGNLQRAEPPSPVACSATSCGW
jgi:hypothetical protein